MLDFWQRLVALLEKIINETEFNPSKKFCSFSSQNFGYYAQHKLTLINISIREISIFTARYLVNHCLKYVYTKFIEFDKLLAFNFNSVEVSALHWVSNIPILDECGSLLVWERLEECTSTIGC